MGHGSLRESYPATISMGQLYRICHISKRKARWLLEQGIIPCVDSGKKTRRFSIQLEDVIIFLERRDAGLLEDAIPRGAFSGGSRPVCPARRALDLSCWTRSSTVNSPSRIFRMRRSVSAVTRSPSIWAENTASRIACSFLICSKQITL
ncbi:Uncharacterised protein [Flavonifractor plautii]|nr:Uncharacterised protein [Flavonifractor plautii]